ncbi:MAG TPA: TrmH family RNA methyltransferase, partial [bacterium]|nr:TrmH family RNA methyltransferase [bacterium]
VADASLVIGTSRRKGAKRGVFIPLPEAIRKVKTVSVKKKAAIVFGKESKGLDNRSLRVCDWITTIPASPEYPSLNLAQAVVIMGFSLFREKKTSPENNCPVQPNYVSKAVIQDVLSRWRKALLVLRYDREGGKDVIDCILMTFHGIFKRAGLVNSESQMLRGIARRIGERLVK